MMLQLTWDETLVSPEGFKCYCGTAALAKSINKDAAGIAFHKKCLASVGHAPSDADGEGTDKGSSDVDKDANAPTRNGIVHEEKITEGVRFQSSNSRRSGRKPKQEEKKKDLYGLLGIQDLRWMATQADIKKAHQKQALKHHPDKTLANVTDEAEKERLVEKFKTIQDAFETLSDPQKRREYDSVDDFDDSLPQTCRTSDFYAVFGSAFRRQARWSIKSPVPDLGDADTKYETVQEFYDFWFSFKSWREFPHEDEEDPECAECREHKRWIERENARLRNKAKKEETRRLREFVDRCYALDPRVLAHKESIRAEKENKKLEKLRAQQEKEEAEKKAAEEAAAQKAAEEEAAKKVAADAKRAKQNDQRELRRQRKRLRDLCAAPESAEGDAERLLEPDDVEELCRELLRPAIESLCSEVESCEDGEDAKRGLLEAALSRVYESRGEEASKKHAAKIAAAAQERAKKKAALREKVAAAKEWSEEEVRMLDKALVKFPVGVPRRWEQVTQYVRTRTQEEIVFMVKIKQGAHASKFQQNDWRAGRKGGVGADVGIGANPDAREQAFTDVRVAGSDAPSEPAAAADAAQGTKAAAETNGKTAGVGTNGGSAPAGTDSAKENQVANNNVWSKEQEMALLKALKAISKDVSDRWDKVADMVEGKDKLACARHFKEMKAQAKGTKS